MENRVQWTATREYNAKYVAKGSLSIVKPFVNSHKLTLTRFARTQDM